MIKTQTIAIASLLVASSLVINGCATTSPHASNWSGPTTAVSVESDPWNFTSGHCVVAGHIISTDHYAIHTTITDREFLNSLAQLMEGAWRQYRALTPGITTSDWPLTSYFFAERSEWAAFTADRTGADAAVYLQIARGGYTVRDWFVSYYIGDANSFSVAAHEGWHQYVARNFRTRLPPFLEEGIATTFEDVHWAGGLPRWNPQSNPNRRAKLARALQNQQLFPLQKLMTMHAGDVVGLPPAKIEAFYAEVWAFALFLLKGDGGTHRAALEKLLSDAASGKAYLKTELPHSALPDAWQPSSARPLLERYLNENIDRIDVEFTAYMHTLASGSIGDFAGGD